ncbi:Plasmodium exported protein (PHIST), unknown function [Plasmodium berghei]|uniref:Plasmodium RESA N-terminal domain-containing protein n=1 Tax=Plasmodium berghei TaxID=5821 RepID=A0A1C6YQ12_PLABE|nr:Plasmodium exported protein (PHIST), unknown function [Plasmodium berghei]
MDSGKLPIIILPSSGPSVSLINKNVNDRKLKKGNRRGYRKNSFERFNLASAFYKVILAFGIIIVVFLDNDSIYSNSGFSRITKEGRNLSEAIVPDETPSTGFVETGVSENDENHGEKNDNDSTHATSFEDSNKSESSHTYLDTTKEKENEENNDSKGNVAQNFQKSNISSNQVECTDDVKLTETDNYDKEYEQNGDEHYYAEKKYKQESYDQNILHNPDIQHALSMIPSDSIIKSFLHTSLTISPEDDEIDNPYREKTQHDIDSMHFTQWVDYMKYAVQEVDQDHEQGTSKQLPDTEPLKPEQKYYIEPSKPEQEENIEPLKPEQEENVDPLKPEQEENIKPLKPEQEENVDPLKPEQEENVDPLKPEQEENPLKPEQEENIKPLKPEQKENIKPLKPEQEENVDPLKPEQDENIKPLKPEQEENIKPLKPEQEENIKPLKPEQEENIKPLKPEQEVEYAPLNNKFIMESKNNQKKQLGHFDSSYDYNLDIIDETEMNLLFEDSKSYSDIQKTTNNGSHYSEKEPLSMRDEPSGLYKNKTSGNSKGSNPNVRGNEEVSMGIWDGLKPSSMSRSQGMTINQYPSTSGTQGITINQYPSTSGTQGMTRNQYPSTSGTQGMTRNQLIGEMYNIDERKIEEPMWLGLKSSYKPTPRKPYASNFSDMETFPRENYSRNKHEAFDRFDSHNMPRGHSTKYPTRTSSEFHNPMNRYNSRGTSNSGSILNSMKSLRGNDSHRLDNGQNYMSEPISTTSMGNHKLYFGSKNTQETISTSFKSKSNDYKGLDQQNKASNYNSDTDAVIDSKEVSETNFSPRKSPDAQIKEMNDHINEKIDMLDENATPDVFRNIWTIFISAETKKLMMTQEYVLQYSIYLQKRNKLYPEMRTAAWWKVHYSMINKFIKREKEEVSELKELLKSSTNTYSNFVTFIRNKMESWKEFQKEIKDTWLATLTYKINKYSSQDNY